MGVPVSLSIKESSGNEICCQALNICRMDSIWRKRTVELMGQRTVVKMISHWVQQLIVKYCISFYLNCVAVSKATQWSHEQILMEMRAFKKKKKKKAVMNHPFHLWFTAKKKYFRSCMSKKTLLSAVLLLLSEKSWWKIFPQKISKEPYPCVWTC